MDAVDVIADQFAIIDERYGRKAAEACLAALHAAGWAVVPREQVESETTFAGMKINLDTTLLPGTIEFRDPQTGEVKARIVGIE